MKLKQHIASPLQRPSVTHGENIFATVETSKRS
jgi:hypothetical protein